MSTVGLYGGNFDPVHNGHLITALRVYELRHLDKIIFVPAFISPFKTGTQSASGDDRFNMLSSAVKGFPFLEVSDYELKKEGISFSIDTVKYLKNIYDEIELIIGYDNLLEFEKWKDPDEIAELATLVVLKRKVTNTADTQNRFFKKAVFPSTPFVEISSTEIRQRVKDNLPVDFLVPESVKEYISRHNLYKE
jgi:nicotinate-nucleotide adenylyltransferase